MARLLLMLVTIPLLMSPVAAAAASPAPNNPKDARLITSDIDHFWEAFDAMSDGDSALALQEKYFDRASPGLKDFFGVRIGSVTDLLDTIQSHPLYYASFREGSQRVASMEPEIRASFRNLKKHYPEAYFPDVYFLVGRMSSGGTTSDAGLLIGVEMYGLSEDTPRQELGTWHQQVLKPMENLPSIVAHELVHVEQSSIPEDQRTLLAFAIREGSADFIAELISGEHINGHIHEYCLPREAALWTEFQEVMGGGDRTGCPRRLRGRTQHTRQPRQGAGATREDHGRVS